jgi:ribosomal protein S18 acetylase RimI-like enzyme
MSGPFSAVDLPGARLIALDPARAGELAAAIVAMKPWSEMNYPADLMAGFLVSADGGVSRYLVEADQHAAGVVSVRYPWLRGPYLELLALLPAFQRRGIGATVLAWLEEEARLRKARNLWVCASSFNADALRFYERHGFRHAAALPDLVADGYEEILLRKLLP